MGGATNQSVAVAADGMAHTATHTHTHTHTHTGRPAVLLAASLYFAYVARYAVDLHLPWGERPVDQRSHNAQCSQCRPFPPGRRCPSSLVLVVAALHQTSVAVAAGATVDLGLGSGVAKQSEAVVSFKLPTAAATFGVTVGGVNCTVAFAPSADASAPYHEVPVACGGMSKQAETIPRTRCLRLGRSQQRHLLFPPVFPAARYEGHLAAAAVGDVFGAPPLQRLDDH